MGYFIDGLADALRREGVPIEEVPGWKHRGYNGLGMTKITGVMWHHTATHRSAFSRSPHPTLNMCTHGRAGLAGPLCHILFDRDGVAHVVAAGWANHAGTGKWTDIPWHHGNDYTIGIEMESSGIPPYDWTPAQIRNAPILGAALRNIFAINNDMSHEEYSDAGKIDPAGWPGDMDGLRRQITTAGRGIKPAAAQVTPIQEDDMPSAKEVAEETWDVEVGLDKDKFQTGSYLLWTHNNTGRILDKINAQSAQIEGLAGAVVALSKGEDLDVGKLIADVEAAAKRGAQAGIQSGIESVTHTETTTAKVK